MTARLVLAAVLVAVALAGCGGSGKPVTTRATAPTQEASILTGAAQTVTFPEVRRAVRRLYANHPEIRNFTYADVFYTPETRDKVLAVCREGGPVSNTRERETSRVFGCAPLIFFFYSFGTQKHVAESVEAARKLFWYATEIGGPYDPRPPLADLLQRWGVR